MKSFKRNFRVVLIPVILLLAALACQRSEATPVTTEQAGDQLHTLTVNGLKRTYLLHVPAGLDLSQPSPLLLVFHGYSGNAEAARLISGFNRIADEEHFIVVYPNGSGAPPELSDVGFTPVEEGISFWAEQNGCPVEARVEQDGAITHTVYAPCRKDTAVELYAVAGTGHTWPLLKIQTSRVIWDFFAAHPKP